MDGGAARAIDEMIVGRVASITGSEVVVLLDDEAAPGSDTALRAGMLARISAGDTWIFGLVTGVTMPTPSVDPDQSTFVFAELELLGESPKSSPGHGEMKFQRGVSHLPAVGAPVMVATSEDISRVYSLPDKATIRLGGVFHDPSIPACAAPDDLLGKHFAVLGSTGTGKSCATALILHRILEANPNAHVVLLDPHNEYAAAFKDMAELIDVTNLKLPYWLFNLEELSAAVMQIQSPEQDAVAEVSILSELIVAAKRNFVGNDEKAGGQLTVDSPVPYRISDVFKALEDEMGRLDKAESLTPYMRLKGKLSSFKADPRYRFMFPTGLSLRDNMAAILSQLFRVPVDGKPITIIDMSSIPSEVINIVVSVLARLTFDFAFFCDRAMPILLVCEEAHRYIPEQTRLGFEPTKRALSRIAKEGRKYGLSLGIVSQRPSDLAIQALSQCNTVFSMRLTSRTDQEFVRGGMPDWSGGLLDLLPSLLNGEAIALGEGVAVPLRMRFDELPPEKRPRSGTASFTSAWQSDVSDGDFMSDLVSRWRLAR